MSKIKIPVTVRRGISKRSHEKIGDCEQSNIYILVIVLLVEGRIALKLERPVTFSPVSFPECLD